MAHLRVGEQRSSYFLVSVPCPKGEGRSPRGEGGVTQHRGVSPRLRQGEAAQPPPCRGEARSCVCRRRSPARSSTSCRSWCSSAAAVDEPALPSLLAELPASIPPCSGPPCRPSGASPAPCPRARLRGSARPAALKGHGEEFRSCPRSGEDEEGASIIYPGSLQPREFAPSLQGAMYLLCLAGSCSGSSPMPFVLFLINPWTWLVLNEFN